MPQVTPPRQLVLIGAGHTNLHVVRMWRQQPISGMRLTLISAFDRATYSGMLPGTLAGLYEPHEMEIDLRRLAAGGEFDLQVARVTGLDSTARRIGLETGESIAYDVAAIGIGSVPHVPPDIRDSPAMLSIKPMQTFRQRLDEQLSRCVRDRSRPEIVIVGGGAAGVEVAFCLRGHLKARHIAANLQIIDAGETVLSGYLPKTQKLAATELSRRHIPTHFGQRAVGHQARQLTLSDGATLPADVVIMATAAAPPPVLEHFDLPKADDGFLAVRRTLQSTGRDDVFVVGDTATLVAEPIPKAGVYAVREGPVLWENLQKYLAGGPLKEYRPQAEFLSLLATGDGRAIGQYRGWAFHSRWAWIWKDYIDRKFMRKHQNYPV